MCHFEPDRAIEFGKGAGVNGDNSPQSRRRVTRGIASVGYSVGGNDDMTRAPWPVMRSG
jgi:hypothetical protein